MKKKLFLLLILSLLFASVLCSCAGKKRKDSEETEKTETEKTDTSESLSNVIFPENQFFIHLYGSATENDPNKPDVDADQTVSMRYFTRRERPEISVARMDDPKAEQACKGVVQNSLNVPMYRGYFYEELQLQFDFSCLEYGETLTVNSITLRIGEEEQTVDTTGRLFLTRLTKEEEDSQTVAKQNGLWLSESAERAEFCLQGEADFRLECIAESDVVIDRLEIGDGCRIDASGECVIEENYGQSDAVPTLPGHMEEALPVSLSQGQLFRVKLQLRPKNANPFSAFQTRILLHYKTASGKEEVLCQPVSFVRSEAYNDADEAVVWMDAYVAPSKEAMEKTIFLEELTYQDCVLTDGGVDEYGNSKKGDIPFTMYFLYHGNLPFIQLEAINGELPGKNDRIYVQDYRNSPQHKEAYQDYRIGKLKFEFDFSDMAPGTQKEIQSIRLSVNGAEKELDTKGRLKFYQAENGTVIGEAGSKLSYETKNVTLFLFRADQPLEVERLVFYGPLTQEKIRVQVDGAELGTPEEVFPLTMGEGQELSVTVNLKYDGLDPNSDVIFSTLLYTRGEAGDERIYRHNNRICRFAADSTNRNMIVQFIEHALKLKEDHT